MKASKRVILCMIILGGLIISGCANAVPQSKETASWSLEGMFVDDIENPACILGIEHKTSEDGSEKEGYYGYFIEGQTFYDVTYEENDGELSGEFISYDDEYVENGRMHANLKEESGNIRMSADSGKEYLLVPDGSEDNDSLKFFQYNSKNVLLAYDGMKTKNPFLYEQDILADYPGLIKKYLRVKEEVLSSCRKQYEKVVPKGVTKYIGVVGRGSDYNMQLTGNLKNYLMRPLSGADMVEKTRELFAKGGYDGIFLATEDASVFDTFMASDLKDKIFYVEQERISYDPTDTSKRFLADIYKEEKERDGYAENLRYLGIIYILSKGSALLSTTLCGAAKMAWGFSENGFEYMDVPGISV